MMQRLFAFAILLMLGVLLASGPARAQQDGQPRSLFESLFGSDDAAEEVQAQPEQEPAPQPEPEPEPAPAPAPEPAPQPAPQAEPQAEPEPQREAPDAPASDSTAQAPVAADAPSESAQRIAVFGDSLAVDLARAIERFYADNPNVRVSEEAVGSSGFVRDDFFDWNAAIEEAIEEDSFDVAIMLIGINDRQPLAGASPLSDTWREAYSARLNEALSMLNAAGKPVVWLELPPMQSRGYSADMAQISSLHRMAIFAQGGEWIETYERFSGEDGGYSARGPDLNGNIVAMRKNDGIHFSAAGADKLAFYVDRALRGVGGATSRSASQAGGFAVTVSDALAGTDAAQMLRPPFQGLGEESQVLAAGSVQQLSGSAARASALLVAGTGQSEPGFTLEEMADAPAGRADAFGVGRAPQPEEIDAGTPAAVEPLTAPAAPANDNAQEAAPPETLAQ